jgi:hypothetical protein
MVYSTRTRGTNPYFNNYGASQEQQLLEDLVIESIKMWGKDMLYLPKTIVSYDSVLGEDDQTAYNWALPIEMYIKTVDGFEGDGEYMSKFGLETHDQITFTVARRTFEQEITRSIQLPRPNEGDLIYFPIHQRLFQILYVNYLPVMYATGALQSYDLICEQFTYSSQQFNTGIEEIDEIQTKWSTDALDYSILTQEGFVLMTENDDYIVPQQYLNNSDPLDEVDDGEEIQEEVETEEIFDWSETDPFSQGGQY